MEKFLKTNLKKIIVICLVVLLISNKVHENFTTVQALDAVKTTEAKVNDIFSHVSNSQVKIDKVLKLNQHMRITNPDARLFFNDDNDNKLFYNADNEGPELKGKKLIKLVAPDGVWSTGPLKAESLCIGNTCIDENHLKLLKGQKYFSIQSKKTDKRLNDGDSDARFKFHRDLDNEAMKIIAIR